MDVVVYPSAKEVRGRIRTNPGAEMHYNVTEDGEAVEIHAQDA